MIGSLLRSWRRRHWHRDDTALAAYAGLTPYKVVTGGSEGIGKAIAAEFLRLGDHVLLVSRSDDKLATAAAALSPAQPDRLATLALDVTRSDATHRIDAKLATLHGYCDLLVNAAGVGIAGAFATNNRQRLDDVVALNIAALTRLSRHVLPGMLIRGRGGILNVASLGGYAPGPYQAAYYASKSYVISLTEAMAFECAGKGIRIAVVAPGPVNTEFHRRMGGATGLYLKVLPVASPTQVARATMWRYRLGQRVIVPGLVNAIMMVLMRLTPHPLSLPVVAALLAPTPLSASTDPSDEP